MRRKGQKAKFWMVLATVNTLALIYPISLYVQADNNDAQFFATMVLLGVVFLLAITDTVSALVAFLQ
jgi:hypothetical protein